MEIGYIAIGAALCLLSCSVAGLGMGLATGKAVSYTHLDVYKRQG